MAAKKAEASEALKVFHAQEAENFEWAENNLHKLSEEQQIRCKHIRAVGLSRCARCRWSSGCNLCDYFKAVRYWLARPQIAPGDSHKLKYSL